MTRSASKRRSSDVLAALFLGICFVAIYGTAASLLAFDARALHHIFSAVVESLRNVPAYGFVFGMLFFAAHVAEKDVASDLERDRGHALNAVLVASVACSLIYDTSYIQFIPFYYNEPSIPIVLLCLYVATERSALAWATPLVFAVSLLPTFGVKLNRALSADTLVTSGQWQGLRVNYRGVEVMKAAARAQEIAGFDGTVLVLPEDVELVGLVYRARPPVKVSVLFVDQYPKRLLAADLRALDANLPDVIIIHPRRVRDWQALYHTWSDSSAAEQILNHVLTDVIPKHYAFDSSYPTIYFLDQGQMDVYAKKTTARAEPDVASRRGSSRVAWALLRDRRGRVSGIQRRISAAARPTSTSATSSLRAGAAPWARVSYVGTART